MSLTVAYETDNIFAKIIRGELPAIKIYEDDVALSFMDIFPQSDGHALVIPKTARSANILDADAADLGLLIVRVQRVARGIVKALEPDGVRILQFNGAPAGQTVFHLHFHIVPIFDDASLKPHAGERADLVRLETLAGRIRAAISDGRGRSVSDCLMSSGKNGRL